MVTTRRIDARKVAFAAEMLKMMGHPLRLRIVEMLEQHEELPAGAFHARLDEAQPTVSQHLNKMRALGLLKARREGGQILYSVAMPQLLKLLQCVRECPI